MTTQELITKLREESQYSRKKSPEIMDLCLDAADRLEYMAQAKAEGRLVELPCKLGDRVWVVYNTMGCTNCMKRHTSCDGLSCPAPKVREEGFKYSHWPQWGRTVFPTCAEAVCAAGREGKL